MTGCGAVGTAHDGRWDCVAWTTAVGTQDGASRTWCQARHGASWDGVTGVVARGAGGAGQAKAVGVSADTSERVSERAPTSVTDSKR